MNCAGLVVAFAGAFLVFSSSVWAHQDTIIRVQKDGSLRGLPAQYQPASVDISRLTVRVGPNRFVLPACVTKHFPDLESAKVEVTASWYHSRKVMPYYIHLKIRPREGAGRAKILLDLETLEFVELEAWRPGTKKVVRLKQVMAQPECRQEIASSRERIPDKGI